MAIGNYTYNSSGHIDTWQGWYFILESSLGYEFRNNTNTSVTVAIEGATRMSTDNGEGFGVCVQIGQDGGSHINAAWVDKNASLNYATWVGNHEESWTFPKDHSPYNVTIWNKTWSTDRSGNVEVYQTITIPKKTNYTVSFNANGGSNAPSSQTKWYGENLTISSSKPTRTGYTFVGWSTVKDGSVSIQPGGTYTENASVTYYAKWQIVTYSITLNGNNGTWAGTKTKTLTKSYGQSLTLPNAANSPTRTNYKLLGWSSTASSSSAQYAIGGSYTNNSSATFYAVWQLDYIKAVISDFKAYRVNDSGVSSDDGTKCKVELKWTSATFGGNEYSSNRKLTLKVGSNAAETISASPGSDTISYVSNSTIDVDQSYTVTVTASDDKGSSSVSVTIPFAYYTMDFKSGGKGVAFGKPAVNDGLDINMPTTIRNDLSVTGNLSVTGWTESLLYSTSHLYFGSSKNTQNVSIQARTPKRNGNIITVYGSTSNEWGDGMVIGDGGYVLIGSGESAENLRSTIGIDPGTESTYVTSDGPVYIVVNCDTIANRKYFNFNNNGTFTSPKGHTNYFGKKLFSGSYASTHEKPITLNETAANFQFIDIQFTTNDGVVASTRVYSPNGKNVTLTATAATTTMGTLWVKSKTVTISGTKINTTLGPNGEYWTGERNMNNDGGTGDTIGITEVWGFSAT